MAAWSLNLPLCGLWGALRGRRCPGRGDRKHGAAGWQASSAAAVGREASQRRAEAMRRCFPKLSSRRADQALLNRIGEADRYLAQAADSADLERRIGELESRAGAARAAP
jgi:hypothetical protein